MSGYGGLIGIGDTPAGTDANITIWGLGHFPTSTTVSVAINGRDLGDYITVGDGSIVIPFPVVGTSIGTFTIATLIAESNGFPCESTHRLVVHSLGVTYTIYANIVIGQPYVAQGQLLRALTPASLAAKQNGLGLRRRTHQYAMLVADAVEVSVGTTFNPPATGDMIQSHCPDQNDSAAVAPLGFDGVVWEVFDDQSTFDGNLCWQMDRPYPFALMAVTQFIHTEER